MPNSAKLKSAVSQVIADGTIGNHSLPATLVNRGMPLFVGPGRSSLIAKDKSQKS
jgi:hypothetical protein